MMRQRADRFFPGYYYHIFNRSVENNNLFHVDDNYAYFLRKYDEYLTAYLQTYCFCLLPNHFHFLVKVRNDPSIWRGLDIEPTITEQFRRFFICYAKSYNKFLVRRGPLFQRPFRKKLVEASEYLTCLVYYIHSNPEKHYVSEDFRTYKWSSYETILSSKPTRIMRNEVLNWFGGIEGYAGFHEENQELNRIEHLIIEE